MVGTQELSNQELQVMTWEYLEIAIGWNWGHFCLLLPHLALLKLASTTIDPLSLEVDKLSWLKHSGVVFMVRSAYELEVGRADEGRWNG